MSRPPLSLPEEVRRSLVKTYRDDLWIPFIAAIKQYRLIEKNDHIAVCISGGKDSLLLAVMLQQLQTHSEVPFSLTFIAMDPGYSAENRQRLLENCEKLAIPLTLFDSNVLRVADRHGGASPCYLCARMRRGHLYAKAKECGCNKIALGHHRDDVIETTLLGMLYGSQLQGMLPRLKSANFPDMELIRPLYMIKEADIIRWQNRHGIACLRCACSVAQKNAQDGNGSKRQEIKELLKNLKQQNPQVEDNIFQSLHRVHINTFPAHKRGGINHPFWEQWEHSPDGRVENDEE